MVRNSCPYCGNNPTPHFLQWYYESLNLLLEPLRRLLLYNPVSVAIKTLWQNAGLTEKFATILIKLKIVSLQDDVAKCQVPRAKVLWQDAQRRGIVMAEFLLLGKPFDLYIAKIRNPKSEANPKSKIQNQKSEIVFSGLPRPKNYDNLSLDSLDDKLVFKQKMRQAGLPVPTGGSVWNFNQAKKIFWQIQEPESGNPAPNPALLKPVIVKPRAGSRGRHTTTFVRSQQDLLRAFKIAKQLCFWVIIEEQLLGPVYRATVINYKLEGLLRGDPPQVEGDGRHNISQLVEIKNSLPHPGVKNIVIDSAMELFLSRQGLKLLSIPAKGQAVNLSEKIGINYGGSSSEDFTICHPENKILFEQAAIVSSDPIVGFDFIIPDIAQSWKGQNCGFIECNTLPFINLHHDPLLGRPRNVAAAVWDLIEW